MVKKLLVLEGGTGGLIISREVREKLGPGEVEITVVDMKDSTEFRPSYLYVAFGYRKPEQISAPLEHLKKYKINFVKARVTKIDPANRGSPRQLATSHTTTWWWLWGRRL